MTAEVALLNKAAVALAADSAMTLAGTGKIYPANKLFALSGREPVGIMFYNSAEFMGVPWETLIKEYRHKLGGTNKERVTEYLDDFLEFIQNEDICTKEQQLDNAVRIASDRFAIIQNKAFNEIVSDASKKKRLSVRNEGNMIRKTIEEELAIMENSGESSSMEAVNSDHIARVCRTQIKNAIDRIFRGLNVFKTDIRLFSQVFKLALKSSELSRGSSGIVVTGFGRKDIFPTLVEVTTDGMIGGKLKVNKKRYCEIGRGGIYSAIMPFAQSEMVQRFMEGIDPDLLYYLKNSMEELLFQFGRET